MQAPDSQAVRTVLMENFTGPITDDVVRRLTEEVAAVIASNGQLGRDTIEFDPANGGRGFGQRWREVLAFDQGTPRPLDLVAWVAFSRRGYPAPLPNCPAELLGKWEQSAPRSATWEFLPDGTMKTTATGWAHRTGWAVHRLSAPLKDMLWLYEVGNKAHKSLSIRSITARQLVLAPPGEDERYVLERA